jgi:nucleotide-binding universal stress UspA family protein
MMKVLMAIDGSDAARRAIEAAGQLARHGAAVDAVLVHVRESPVYCSELPPFDFQSIENSLRQRQDALLEAAFAQARNSGLLLGSVAQHVAHLATAPVMLVK